MSEYHPQVEHDFVTSGPDMGRVKDVELAYDLAASENGARAANADPSTETRSPEELQDGLDKFIKYEVGKRAINVAIESAEYAVDVTVVPSKYEQVEIAKSAARSFDELQDTARSSRSSES